MKKHWADKFRQLAELQGVECKVLREVNGWIETMAVSDRKCFTKSMTYNLDQQLYFQGVDPKKLDEHGDDVVLCGGTDDRLRDIFIIPWDLFFEALKSGKPLNTYSEESGREYYQYKIHLRESNGAWSMSIEKGKTIPDLKKWRYDPCDAVEVFRKQH